MLIYTNWLIYTHIYISSFLNSTFIDCTNFVYLPSTYKNVSLLLFQFLLFFFFLSSFISLYCFHIFCFFLQLIVLLLNAPSMNRCFSFSFHFISQSILVYQYGGIYLQYLRVLPWSLFLNVFSIYNKCRTWVGNMQ